MLLFNPIKDAIWLASSYNVWRGEASDTLGLRRSFKIKLRLLLDAFKD